MTQNRLVAATATRYEYASYHKEAGHQRNARSWYPIMALSLLGLVGGYEMMKKMKLNITAECCGIIGYVGQENIAGKLILDGIQILQYRGYDS